MENNNIGNICFALAVALVLVWTTLGATGVLDLLVVWLKS